MIKNTIYKYAIKIFENIFLTKDSCCVIIFEPHIVGFVSCARKRGCTPIFSETVKYQAGVKNVRYYRNRR